MEIGFLRQRNSSLFSASTGKRSSKKGEWTPRTLVTSLEAAGVGRVSPTAAPVMALNEGFPRLLNPYQPTNAPRRNVAVHLRVSLFPRELQVHGRVPA